MAGWTKLFSSITTSSIWCATDAILRVWIAMLASADARGVVEGSIPGFANLARVTPEEMLGAIEFLSSPDPYSRTPDHDGRRIEAVPGGWKILNYLAYRERVQAKDGSRAPYYRERRARDVARNSPQQSDVARNTEERRERLEAVNGSPLTPRAAARVDVASVVQHLGSRGFADHVVKPGKIARLRRRAEATSLQAVMAEFQHLPEVAEGEPGDPIHLPRWFLTRPELKRLETSGI